MALDSIKKSFRLVHVFSGYELLSKAGKTGVLVCETFSYLTMLARLKARVRLMLVDNVSTIGVGKTIILHFKTSRVHNAVYDAFSYVTNRLKSKAKSEGSE